jgi:hypothetical protein
VWAQSAGPSRRSASSGDVDDRFGEGLRRFLGQIVPDNFRKGSKTGFTGTTATGRKADIALPLTQSESGAIGQATRAGAGTQASVLRL